MYTMNKISYKNNWNPGIVNGHIDPPPILLIKINNDEKSDKDSVKINCVGI